MKQATHAHRLNSWKKAASNPTEPIKLKPHSANLSTVADENHTPILLVDGSVALGACGQGVRVLLGNYARESFVRDPLGRVSRGRLFKHFVDLLEGKTFGFRHQKVRVHKSGCAEAAPDEEHARLQVALVTANHVGRDDSDDSIPQPI